MERDNHYIKFESSNTVPFLILLDDSKDTIISSIYALFIIQNLHLLYHLKILWSLLHIN